VTLDSTQTIINLVFNTKQPGQSQLDWYTSPLDSYFLDASGQMIPVEYWSGQVNIYNPPIIYMDELKHACVGQEVTLTGIATSDQPPVTYEWTYPDGHTTTTEPYFESVSMADAGVYTLHATDALFCDDRKSIRLIVHENPVAEFHGKDTLVVPSGYELHAGDGMASYLWNTLEVTESIEITEEGMYVVELTSLAGCFGIDSVYVRLIESCIYIPNAFTPNGDGLNDTFMAISYCQVDEFLMLIYNRWGEQLYESDNISNGWDGTKDGRGCPGDAYVYKITMVVEGTEGTRTEEVFYGVFVLLK
jgi:gliding motility-associated-like protein